MSQRKHEIKMAGCCERGHGLSRLKSAGNSEEVLAFKEVLCCMEIIGLVVNAL
jgi:hypothetical protein